MRKFNESKETKPATSEPKTLRELGVDGSLAWEMEMVFQLLGVTRGDLVQGYTFRTPDGARHSLRSERSEGEKLDRAA